MSWSPGMVPYGADQTVYLVVDSSGNAGGSYLETEFERSDLETVISDLMNGQFDVPIRVVAFNTLEHWADDVSGQVAEEIQTRCDIEGESVPQYLRDFVEMHGGARQWAMRAGEIRGSSSGGVTAVRTSY